MLQGDVGPGEILFCVQNEPCEDHFAVVVMSQDDVVGYIPLTILHLVLHPAWR